MELACGSAGLHAHSLLFCRHHTAIEFKRSSPCLLRTMSAGVPHERRWEFPISALSFDDEPEADDYPKEWLCACGRYNEQEMFYCSCGADKEAVGRGRNFAHSDNPDVIKRSERQGVWSEEVRARQAPMMEARGRVAEANEPDLLSRWNAGFTKLKMLSWNLNLLQEAHELEREIPRPWQEEKAGQRACLHELAELAIAIKEGGRSDLREDGFHALTFLHLLQFFGLKEEPDVFASIVICLSCVAKPDDPFPHCSALQELKSDSQKGNVPGLIPEGWTQKAKEACAAVLEQTSTRKKRKVANLTQETIA